MFEITTKLFIQITKNLTQLLSWHSSLYFYAKLFLPYTYKFVLPSTLYNHTIFDRTIYSILLPLPPHPNTTRL